MSLRIALGNALSGMGTSQGSLEVLSRNVANAGTPGYHRQSLSIVERTSGTSSYPQTAAVQRAFNESLQAYYTRSVSDSGYSNVRADVLDRLQTYLGKPGDPGGLDASFSAFQNALQQLSASPDSYAARASVVSQAQAMATTLNSFSGQVQQLRQETELKLKSDVDGLNQAISSLANVNERLADPSADPAARAALLDQRDRLVESVSEMVDLRVDYHGDGSVTLATRSGVGILDGKPSLFEFQSAGALSPTQRFDIDPEKSGVGALLLHTPAGLTIDLVQQNVIRSGELAGLIDLRDKTLPGVQEQLDDIAAGLAQSLSTVTTDGTPASSGSAQGFDLDLGSIRDGNDFVVQFTQGGVAKTLRVVRVDDTSKLPLDYIDANGTRVLGIDFSAGVGSVAPKLQAALGGGFAVSNPSGSTLRVLDDGAANTTSITSLTGHSTATGLQTGGLALNLFVDAGNADFTDSRAGNGQRLGFAGRIALNSAIVTDNRLLVQYLPNLTLGDAARASYMSGQLDTMRFASSQNGPVRSGQFRLGGTISDMISQALDYQGSVASGALNDRDAQKLTMETLTARMDGEYGVNVDEEMGRLIELQNAYAANARVISVVQDLMQRLLNI